MLNLSEELILECEKRGIIIKYNEVSFPRYHLEITMIKDDLYCRILLDKDTQNLTKLIEHHIRLGLDKFDNIE